VKNTDDLDHAVCIDTVTDARIRRVRILKCTTVGIVSAIVAAIGWAVVVMVFTFRAASDGGLGAVSIGFPELMWPGLVGFLLGFALMFTRLRTRPT
jgi:hypothetical protein